MKVGNIEFHRPAALSLRAQATVAKRILRFVMFVTSGVILLLLVGGIAVSIIIQTDWFHRWSAIQLENILKQELEATVEFSSLKVNIFRGVTIDSVRVIAAADTLLRADRMILGYEIEPLLIRKIVISRVELANPTIKILRSASDSTWNVEHIIAQPKDTTSSKPFDWGITIKRFVLQNASLRVLDSLAEKPIHERISWTDLTVDSLHTDIATVFNLAQNNFTVAINALQCKERRTGLDIRSLALSAHADTSLVEITTLRLVTNATNLSLRASMDSVNLFSSNTNLAKQYFTARVDAKKIDTRDINYILPPTFSLANTASLAADVMGTLSTLAIHLDELVTNTTKLYGDVMLYNLDGGGDFAYDVALKNSFASIDDVRAFLPTVPIPSLAFLNRLTLNSASVVGRGSSLAINLDALGVFGGVNGKVHLLTNDPLSYDVDVMVRSFSLNAITGSTSLSSLINGHAVLKGKGTTLRDADCQVQLQLTPSEIAGRPLQSLICNASLRDGGFITVDTLLLGIQTSPSDSTDPLESYESRTLVASGTVDIRSINYPIYIMNIGLDNFPLARLIGEPSAPRFVSGTFEIQGTGFNPDSLDGFVHSSIKKFVLADRALLPFTLDCSVHRQSKDVRTLVLTSTPFDATIDGRFKMSSILPIFLANIDVINRYVNHRIDVMNNHETPIPFRLSYRLPNDTIDMKFSASVRNLSPLSPFIQGVQISALGELRGGLKGTPQCYELAIDTASIPRFMLRKGTTFIVSQPLTLHAVVRSEDLNSEPFIAQTDIEFSCDSLIRAGNTYFVRPRFSMRYTGDKTEFALSTRMNTMPILASGSIELGENEYNVTLDSLRYGISRAFAFTNTLPVRATLTPRGLMINVLELEHDSSSARVAANGLINSERFNDLRVNVKNFNLQELQRIPSISQIEPLTFLDGMVDSVTCILNGTYDKPRFSSGGRLLNLRYNDIAIGEQEFSSEYDTRDLRAESWIAASDTTTRNSPHVRTTSQTIEPSKRLLQAVVHHLPLDISLVPFTLALRPGELIDISIDANAMPLAAAAPFIPGVSHVDGSATAALKIRGTAPDDINYTGNISIKDASFIVSGTNLRYVRGVGNITLNNSNVTIDSLRIYNDPLDDRRGRAKVTGTAKIRGFNIESVDIYAEVPRLLVMSNATQVVNPTLYGDMLIATGKDPLHFFGTLSEPVLNGDVEILSSNLFFPPTSNTKLTTGTFDYVRVGEKYVWQQKRTSVDVPVVTDTTFRIEEITEKNGVGKEKPMIYRIGQSLSDVLYTDVNVTIPSSMRVTMNFGVNEQLVANVAQEDRRSRLRFVRNGNKSSKLYGNLSLLQGSDYKFYNTMQATGTLSYPTGEIANPTLKLEARYRSERTINDRRQGYEVLFKIDSTKNRPSITATYFIDGIEAPNMRGDKESTMSNALLMLLFGKTQDELIGGSSNSNIGGDVLGQGVASTASAFASKTLTDFLQGTGVIKNINIDFAGSQTDLSQARIRLQGQFADWVSWTYGGSLGDFTQNSNITVDASIGSLFDNESLRNLILQFTRSANPGQNVSRLQKEWEAKVRYRISF